MDTANSNNGDRVAYWQAVVEEQKKSGLSIPSFCTERGVVLSQFYYWRRRLVPAENSLPEPGAGQGPAFVELELDRQVTAGAALPLEIRLDLGAGCTLSIRRG
ncbi:MAG: IS66 family insertion sequence element accessory protein TnpA [Phycisphaerae bacterium]